MVTDARERFYKKWEKNLYIVHSFWCIFLYFILMRYSINVHQNLWVKIKYADKEKFIRLFSNLKLASFWHIHEIISICKCIKFAGHAFIQTTLLWLFGYWKLNNVSCFLTKEAEFSKNLLTFNFNVSNWFLEHTTALKRSNDKIPGNEKYTDVNLFFSS